MDEKLRDYMSQEEQAQMDTLMARAKARKARREESANGSMRLQFFECRCGCPEEAPKEEMGMKALGGEECFEMGRLLQQICNFCHRYDLCQCQYHREQRERKELEGMFDDDLPF